jgi:hypothetical protein
MLAIVALVYVGGRAWRSLLHVRTGPERRSPFTGIIATRQPTVVPQAVRRLAAEIGGAGDPRVAERRAIAVPLRSRLAAEAARRLAEHHGLDIADPLHHERIRSLVSEPTQLLILGDRDESGAHTQEAGADIPLARLNEILDDLERL